MIYYYEFEIRALPKTTNTGGRAHWATKVREARMWKKLVYLAIRLHLPAAPLEKARLTLTRRSSSEPDFDGLVSSFKHALDGLVDARVIVSDKPSVIGQPFYRWEKAKPKAGSIKIRIEGIE